jgi:hypothetical protein
MNSHFNNTTTPLGVSQKWVGGNEITQPNPLICVSIKSSSYCLLTIKQTNDLVNYDQVDSYNISPTGRYIQELCKCTYAHVEVLNVDSVAQTYLSVATTFTNQNQLQDSIAVSNLPIVNQVGHNRLAVSVDNWTTSNVVAVSITGNNTVKIDPAFNIVAIAPNQNINTTPAMLSAQLRHTPLVVGHWYQIASVGDTPPAVWTEMGAIWGSESAPPIGRQFQCLYAGYGTGTCYDITAPVAPVSVASYQYNSGVFSINAGSYTSSPLNINNYNLVDVFLSFGTAVSITDSYVLQISPDNGTTWFDSSTFTLTGMPPKGTIQLNTSATQVRVQGTVSASNTLQIWLTAKST